MRTSIVLRENPVALTALYALALGVVMALENVVDIPDVFLVAVWLFAPVVGFLVGRWWVVLAVAGAVVGRMIGWDSAEHDGNPALWPPYLVSMILLIGLPLLLGVMISEVRDNSRRRQHA